MKLSTRDIRKIFKYLIDGKISREEADRWAYIRIKALDSNDLSFLPKSDEKILWDGVLYLFGIDIKISPDEYMYSIEDIEEEYVKKKKNKDA